MLTSGDLMNDTPLEFVLCRIIWALALIMLARTLIQFGAQLTH